MEAALLEKMWWWFSLSEAAVTTGNPGNMKIREEFKAAEHLKQTK